MPSELVIHPDDTILRVGDTARFAIGVLDQHGVPFAGVPAWATPRWRTPDPAAVYLWDDGRVEAGVHVDTEVRATFAGLAARTRLRVNPKRLVLSVPAVTVTQAVQNSDGDVPLIAGRAALLRIFATGDLPSFYRPRATASFYLGDELVHWADVALQSESFPTEVDEGRLDMSFNVPIPGGALRPGVELVVEIDREGAVPHAPGSQLRVPAEGRMPLDVRQLGPLELTVVPVEIASDSAPEMDVRAWAAGLTIDGEELRLPRAVLPIAEITLLPHDGIVTTADLETGEGWGQLLAEIAFLRTREGSRGYYYGAVAPDPSRRWRGLGIIGFPASVGTADTETLTHELGHNMALQHAPCGGTGDADEDYPYENGVTGAWGYDPTTRRLVHPLLHRDVMGYCAPRWVSDYHFARAIGFREHLEEALVAPATASDGTSGRVHQGTTLLLWGRVGDEGVVLDPAFVTDLPPTMPAAPGPYRLEGFGEGGRSLFSLSFSPRPTEFGGGMFLFAVPFDTAVEGSLARVELSGPAGSAQLEPSGSPPMALVTDRATGRLRAVLRDWSEGDIVPVRGDIAVAFSEGLPR